jgi:hypothetical protein
MHLFLFSLTDSRDALYFLEIEKGIDIHVVVLLIDSIE